MKRFQTVIAVSGSGRRPHVATEDFHHQRGCVAAGLFVRWSHIRAALLILALAMSVLCYGVVPACAQESSAQGSSEIAKQAQNPIASLQAISYMPQQNYAAAKVEHSEKVLSVSFVADN